MNPLDFQFPAWYLAATLTERLATRRAAEAATNNGASASERALKRLQRWKAQPPFDLEPYFAERLAMDAVSEEELLRLIDEPAEAVQARYSTAPEWVTALANGFNHGVGADAPVRPSAWAAESLELGEENWDVGFLIAVRPLLQQGEERLSAGIAALQKAYPDAPIDPETIQAILATGMTDRVVGILCRTMVLELNVARVEGLLEGETPQERFRSFARRLERPEVLHKLFEEYPVLARLVLTSVEHHVASRIEFLARLCADWAAIRETLSPDADPGLLVEVQGEAGDLHRGGRAVMIVRFSSGFQVVYKPRSVALEAHFQDLLLWLNERGATPPFYRMRFLDRQEYGWVEFIYARDCDSPDQVRRFYERFGGLLALLYLLEGSDVHYENIIASSEHPVLIDLESLFQPHLEELLPNPPVDLTEDVLVNSVLRIGLLPQRPWGPGEDVSDVSGLVGSGGQTSTEVAGWQGVGTDEMRFTRVRAVLQERSNRAKLNGQAVNVPEHADAIVGGFTRVYRLLADHRETLLAADGPLAAFHADEVRILLRATQVYSTLLQESYHPNLLRNALDRDRFLDRLWMAVENFPYLQRVLPWERNEMQEGDIPLFVTRPASRDLWSGTGERIPEFFVRSGWELVERRVRQLGEEDLRRQAWFITSTLGMMPAPAAETDANRRAVEESEPALDRGELLGAACAIGDRLETTAFRDGQELNWISLQPDLVTRRNVIGPLDTDLYAGLPGVALFLAYLGEISGEERYTALARGAVRTLRRLVREDTSRPTSLGGFHGWGGVIYGLTHLGVLWREPELLAEAEAWVELLPPLIEQDTDLDLVTGTAGCILSLVGLHEARPSTRTLAVTRQCGERLLATARQMPHGLGWITPANQKRPLAGLSHGAAGFALALAELAARTGDARFREAALAALAYERTLFSAEAGNWRDLRPFGPGTESDEEGEGSFPIAWCHGAAGIGLGRLFLLRHLDDATIRSEIATALQTTLKSGFGMGHCLCHGDLGNLETLLQASLTFGEEFRSPVEQTAGQILASIWRRGRRCGAEVDVEVPGLMIGIAGIGYGLLRVAEPGRVPSVLALAPPPRHA
jgi:type 2 lantibiotic biosynthesis protein LanM